MSEKRFIFVDNIFKYLETGIKDNKSDYDSLNGESVVDLLNRQQTSIETMLENMEKLEKENKELGKNFDDIVKWASEIAKRNVLLDERIGKIQQAIKRAYEEKPYPTFEDIQAKIKELNDE